MSMFHCSVVPGYSFWVCGVEVFLNLRFGGSLDTYEVRELHRVIAMDVDVVTIVLKYVHCLASANEVVDAVFDLLW